ncbi:MAG: rRNA maturation RNase YbeY [bacterium]
MKLNVNIFNRNAYDIDTAAIEALAHKIWMSEGERAASLNIIFVEDDVIKRLNKKYFNKNRTTDVIAFPLSESGLDGFEGEIYVSVDSVSENAAFYKVNLAEEMRRVVAHGLLHFLGYRDDTKEHKHRMTERENYYLG